ncbi:patatin-like phospholipase family protein [Maritimibacter fusiformis]|uniref:Alpha/beta hydrolase n=1 Tax=Maritimibacter fusiformis TaxID=2603819 RepID=A0A5D0RJ83_9RHOB|nr:patatin-like phospholipase family protein [Maritimibacter fusiformis]TYB81503.1 alpha/beta hydrolase [Maritimibacter fusiformis]
MRDKEPLAEKAVPVAAAAAARRAMLPYLVSMIARRTTPPRIPYSLADQLAARVPGYGDIRLYVDAPAHEIAARQDVFLPGCVEGARPAEWLVLSSGGAGGAFGAGVLSGWSEHGDRPRFDLVTGVSAGALIAPFAFIGSEADAALANVFTGASTDRLNRSRSLMSGVFGQSAIPAAPLRELIDGHVDAAFCDRIAARHDQGARLLIVTANLDAQRNVVWDLGAIAASGQPDRVRLMADLLQASASIPAILPPVRIAVIGNGVEFDELHADGGVMSQIYMVPDALWTDPSLARLCPRISTIVNAEIAPSFAVIEQQSIRVAERALASLEKYNLARGVGAIADFARRIGARFRLASIDQAIPAEPHLPFDPVFMAAAFALGRDKGLSGKWENGPPVGTVLLDGQ